MSVYSTTTDPKLLEVNIFYKEEFYKSASNYLNVVEKYFNLVKLFIDYNKSKVSNDVINSQANFFIELDKVLGAMQPQFAAFWIEKFNSSINLVKKQVLTKLSNSIHYRPLSDSMCILSRQDVYLDDSTQFVSDVAVQNQPPPTRYGASTINKINPLSFFIHNDLSKKLNMVFRKNLQNIQFQAFSSQQAHGGNLVPDTFAQSRNSQNSNELKINVFNEYKSLFPIILYYCNYNQKRATNNLQYVSNPNILVNVEGSLINQDLLFNQLADINSKLTSQIVLGSG